MPKKGAGRAACDCQALRWGRCAWGMVLIWLSFTAGLEGNHVLGGSSNLLLTPKPAAGFSAFRSFPIRSPCSSCGYLTETESKNLHKGKPSYCCKLWYLSIGLQLHYSAVILNSKIWNMNLAQQMETGFWNNLKPNNWPSRLDGYCIL